MDPNQTPSQTKVPPPPVAEVSVRTMSSDIKAISQGEVTPSPEIITAAKMTQPEAPTEETSADTAPVATKKSRAWVWVLVAIAGALVAGVMGYLLAG